VETAIPIMPLRWGRQRGAFVWVRDPGAKPARRQPSEMFLVRHDYAADLVKRPKMRPLGALRIYDPNTEPGLFWRLAKVEPTVDSVLEFIDEFGALGLSVRRTLLMRDGAATEIDVEPFSAWQVEVWHMREAINAAHAIGLLQGGPSFPGKGIALDSDVDRLSRWLLGRINESRAPARLIRTELGAYRDAFVPRTLREVIWSQFANAIKTERAYKLCAYCGDPFEIGGGWTAPQSKRADAKYCSASCRSMASLKRKAGGKRG